jgi:tRNA1Val (adenine37-N6)-methyltransferase
VTDDVWRGWTRPGPKPPGGVDVEDGEVLDYLCGHWRIFQYARGHKYSIDDVLVAHYGTTWAPRVERACDLGSGIGSVAFVSAWRLPGARFTTIEAQDVSVRLARKTARYDGVEDRFTILHGDLRTLDAGGAFDLVTGSPPYWPVGGALAAAHPQAVPARLEVRGSIADYAQAAARLLAPGGLFATVFPIDQRERARAGIEAAGLIVLRSRDVLFKEGEAYGLVLWAAMRREDLPSSFHGGVVGKPVVEPPLVVRMKDGGVSPEYATLRLSYGFPPGDMAR